VLYANRQDAIYGLIVDAFRSDLHKDSVTAYFLELHQIGLYVILITSDTSLILLQEEVI
jgi:hypothetical protein